MNIFRIVCHASKIEQHTRAVGMIHDRISFRLFRNLSNFCPDMPTLSSSKKCITKNVPSTLWALGIPTASNSLSRPRAQATPRNINIISSLFLKNKHFSFFSDDWFISWGLLALIPSVSLSSSSLPRLEELPSLPPWSSACLLSKMLSSKFLLFRSSNKLRPTNCFSSWINVTDCVTTCVEETG